MFKQFELLAARYDAFNQQKMVRALETMSKSGRRLLSYLPVLFHYHHPHLPGFVAGEVPSGIALFQPDALQQKYFCLQTGQTNLPDVSSCAISAIYTMGSTASIGQNAYSDLDIWICHNPELPVEQLSLLEQKCSLISHLAQEQGVEMNFFLIPENKFHTANQAELGLDNCGSAQHYLLLEEFYRSAMRIAGKRLLWHILPVERETEYDALVSALFSTGMISESDWLDLGGIGRIPAEEYFGSALWLLYKGLDSPYKAVLKILVMEAYSAEFPHTELLAMRSKRWFQEHDLFGPDLDPYYLMLEKVTEYLVSSRDLARLDLARRCFYMKTHLRLSQPAVGPHQQWRREQLMRLVRSWGWTHDTLRHLDSRKFWKVEQVKETYDELLSALMQSYSKLIQFARRNNISESINPEDIGILSRKLYTAFEALPGKVQRINLRIAPDLHEEKICFIQVPPGRINRQGWYVYKTSLVPTEVIGHKPLEYNGYLSKLVAWCYFNGLLVKDTKVHLREMGSDITLETLERFCDDLAITFPVNLPPASNLALSRPCEIRHLGIFVNLERDPTSDWPGEMPDMLHDTDDILSYGEHKECLVGSIDLVYRNSWNEIRTLHFSGPEAVPEALSTILGKMHQDASAPDAVDVFCYSDALNEAIRSRFAALINESISLRLALDKQRLVKLLTVGDVKYALLLERRGVAVKPLQGAIDFYRHVSDNKLERQTGNAELSIQVPSVVDAYASEGLIQYFFEDCDNGFNVYILDEENKVEVYHEYAGSKEDLVQNVNRYYTMAHTRFESDDQFINFNLPQFYELVYSDLGTILEVVPYRSLSREMLQQQVAEVL